MKAADIGCGDEAAKVRRAARGWLRNPVREPGVTCRVCTTPVDGFGWCWRCHRDGRIAGMADVVAPLTYAIDATESAALIRDYKNHPVRKVREDCSSIINWLLFLAVTRHERCIGAAAGLPVSLRLTIPSLTSRAGVHPFLQIAQEMNAVADSVALVPGPDGCCDRAIRADKFAVQPDLRLDGQHVLVLDDSWTTGSNAQSAALTLRRAGASAVSVLVVGRWLSPGFGKTAEFVATRLQNDYNPHLCPVTGGVCP